MCTLDRRRTFEDHVVAEAARRELLRTATTYRVEVMAYVFMPDHLHAVLNGLAADSDLLRFMDMFRQRTGYAYPQKSSGRLWQEGYDDRFLRAEESTLDVVAYVVANPIRAGLCKDIRDYPFLGSSRYSIDELIAAIQIT
jgi:REP element-mobilizing transposase RayT